VRTVVPSLLIALSSCAVTASKAAEEGEGDAVLSKPTLKQGPRRSPDDVSYLRARGDEPGDGLLGDGLIALLEPLWFEHKRKLKESTGFHFGIAYTSLVQKATDSVAGPDHAGSGDLDLFASWRLVGDQPGNSGYLHIAFEDRHAYTSISPSELGGAIGSLWPTTRAFDEHEFALIQIFWDQQLADDAVEFRIGAYDNKTIYEQYTFRSETFYFQNLMFSGNISFRPPGGGFGGSISWRTTESTYILAGIADANGRRAWPELSSFFSQHEYFYIAEFGYSPRLGPDDLVHASVTLWHVDAREDAGTAAGSGGALNLEYAHGDVIPFLRYAYADADAETVYARQNVNAGCGWMRPFGRADDVFALAAGAGQEVGGSRWQTAIETFYRVQLTSYTQLTASVQGIFNPIDNPAEDALAVFGLRLRFQL